MNIQCMPHGTWPASNLILRTNILIWYTEYRQSGVRPVWMPICRPFIRHFLMPPKRAADSSSNEPIPAGKRVRVPTEKAKAAEAEKDQSKSKSIGTEAINNNMSFHIKTS